MGGAQPQKLQPRNPFGVVEAAKHQDLDQSVVL